MVGAWVGASGDTSTERELIRTAGTGSVPYRNHLMGDMAFHGYVRVQNRGVLALPAELRRRLHLDEPGAQVEITEREDGVLELRPALPIAADQRWFWSSRWQQREREADEHIAAGRVSVHDDGDALLEHLDTLDDAMLSTTRPKDRACNSDPKVRPRSAG